MPHRQDRSAACWPYGGFFCVSVLSLHFFVFEAAHDVQRIVQNVEAILLWS